MVLGRRGLKEGSPGQKLPHRQKGQGLRTGKDLGGKTESPLTTAKRFTGGSPLPTHHHPAVLGGRDGGVPPCARCVRSGWRKPQYLILRKTCRSIPGHGPSVSLALSPGPACVQRELSPRKDPRDDSELLIKNKTCNLK